MLLLLSLNEFFSLIFCNIYLLKWYNHLLPRIHHIHYSVMTILVLWFWFFAKLFVFVSLIDGYFYIVSIFAVLTSVLSAFYYLRLIKILYFEKTRTWIFFDYLSKSYSFVLVFSSFIVLLFLVSPNFFYLLSYKLGLIVLI